MQNSLLGPTFSDNQIKLALNTSKLTFKQADDHELYSQIAEYLADGRVVGWFRGRMEFGPRALGGRSILGDPRNPKLQSEINRKIKFRESFRPFAPVILESFANKYFELDQPSPYMLIVAPLLKKQRLCPDDDKSSEFDQIHQQRSCLPAITHVDYSARVQTVKDGSDHPLSGLLEAFGKLTGLPALINTSFNIRGEPIVCAPKDACHCFINTNMDYLVLENFIVSKAEQRNIEKDLQYVGGFSLD